MSSSVTERTSVLEDALAEARSDDWRARADALRAELDSETDKARAALLAYELGELSERRLRDEPGAVKAYGRALQADPSFRPNLWAIRRVFYRRGLWPNLIKLIDAEIRFARTHAERADLYVEKGQILEDRSGERTAARDAYDRAIALVPTHVSALIGRERIAFAEGDGDTLLRVWRLLADATYHTGRKASYLLDLARLQAQADIPKALLIVDEAAALTPAPEAGIDPMVIARERERLAEASGDVETFLQALETRIQLLEGKPLDVAALRRHQARVVQSLGGTGDFERAWMYLELAAEAAPGEALILYDMADLAEDTGKGEQLASILERLLAIEPNPRRRLALSLRRADALARTGRDEQAEAVLDDIVARAPGYLPVLELRERRALADGDWERLARLRSAEAVAAHMGTAFGPGPAEPDAAWAAASYVSTGDIYDLRLGRAEEARVAYQQALEAVPGYAPAVEALVGLYLRAGRTADAVLLLEAQLDRDPPARAEEILERLALLHEREGRTADALSALERLAARRPDDQPLWFRLERTYEALGRHEERAGLLLRIAESIDDAPRRAALLEEVGRIHDIELGNPEGAVAAYRAALALDPQDRVVRGALVHLYRKTGRWEELGAELRAEAEVATGAGAARALRAAAAVLERKLGQPGEAVNIYRDLLDRMPDDAGAVRALASALPDSPELAAVLEAEVGLHGGGAAAGQALQRLGELYERLGREEDALAAYRRALAEGGVSLHAHWTLLLLAARRRDLGALAEALAGLADRVRDDALAADFREELAWLTAPEGDGETAAARFDALARRAPDRRGVELGKALVAARRRDAGELAAALIAQAERTSDARVAAALYLRAATLREVATSLGAPMAEGAPGAPELAARALHRTPEDAGAVVAAIERGAPADDGERLAVLGRRAALAESAEARSDFDLERARLLGRLGRLHEAGQVLRDLLAAVPGHLDALLLLHKIASAAGDEETRAAAALRLGQALETPVLAADKLREAALLYDDTLGRPEEAGPVWRQLYELDPSHVAAYDRAHGIFTAHKDTAALLDLVSRKIEVLQEDVRVVPHRMERARLLRAQREDGRAAVDLEAVLALDAGHMEALSELADVRLAQGDPGAAALLLRQYNDVVEHPDLRADAENRLSHILEGLGDSAGAIDALAIVLTVRPEDVRSRARLVDLHLRGGSPERAAEELERLAARRDDVTARAQDELHAARLWLATGDPVRALKALERAQKLDPLNVEALRELAALLEGGARAGFLDEAATDVRTALRREGVRPAAFAALEAIAELSGDEALGAFAGGALAVLRAATPATVARLGSRRDTLAAARPKRPLTEEEWRTRIEHAGARGPLGELWNAVVESVARAGPWEPGELGFGKADRVAPKQVASRLPQVDAAARALGLTEYEVYVSAARPGTARAVPLEVPVVYLGDDVARAESLEARVALALTLAAARQRLGPLDDMSVDDVRLVVAAAMKVGGGDPSRLIPLLGTGATAKLDERIRLIGKASRRDRKLLAAAAPRLHGDEPLEEWMAAMRATVRRAALLLVGDVESVVVRLPSQGPVAADLIAWSVSDAHLRLRSEMGL